MEHPKSTQTASPTNEYDIIVVGGGTAGCALASRLSEEPSLQVLLVESGESSARLMYSVIPATFPKLFKTKHDFALTTVPQPKAGGTTRFWPRARMLGGCSAINAMIFHHCAPSDHDEWPKFLGKTKDNSIWSYQGLKKYFLKLETFIPHKDHPDIDLSERGSSGPVKTGYFGHNAYIAQQFLRACEAIGIPATPDVNTSKGTMGVTEVMEIPSPNQWLIKLTYILQSMTYIDPNGRRVTSESSFLTPEVQERPNLRIISSTTVTKVIFDEVGDQPRAIGVEYATSRGGPRLNAGARKEVILCAGAIHSPHILMLSGIGPAAQLASHNVPVLVDLPGVGEHLMDHSALAINFLDKSGHNLGWTRSFFNFKSLFGLLQWYWRGTGPFAVSAGGVIGFIRADDPKLFPDPQEYPLGEDSTSGPKCPDLELIVSPMPFNPWGLKLTEPAFSLHAVALRPTSLGTLRLKSNDPFDAPEIDPRYLDTEHDLRVLVKGVEVLLRVAEAEPLASKVMDRSGDDDPKLDHHLFKATRIEIEEFVRKRVNTLYHPTCTARMAKREDGGVVDEELKVYGVRGLRVVDASVFPTIPAGHTSAPAYVVAERAADLIKAEHANA